MNEKFIKVHHQIDMITERMKKGAENKLLPILVKTKENYGGFFFFSKNLFIKSSEIGFKWCIRYTLYILLILS